MSEQMIYDAGKVYPPYDYKKYKSGEEQISKETEVINLYHVTGWDSVKDLKPGDALTLKPGEHNAQGEGVYFSEDVPRIGAADALVQGRKEPVAIIEITPQQDKDWYKSKPDLVEKYQKPRTWHTSGKEMRLVVLTKNYLKIDDYTVPIFHCAHRWIQPNEEKHPDIVIE